MHASALRAELIKLHRAPIWVAFIILPLVAAAIGTFNYQSNIEILKSGWFDLWTQHTLFESMFFLQALIGVSCSWLMRLEHQGANWNQLMASPVSAARVLVAKLAVGWLMLGVALAAIGTLFVACGRLVGLPDLPGPEYMQWLALAWVGGVASVACQLFASLVIRNFAAPVGVAVIGGIVGFLAYAYGSGYLCPYALIVMALNSNGHGAIGAEQMVPFLAATAAFTVLALGAATHILSRRDIRTS